MARKKKVVENVTITGLADKGYAAGRSPAGEVVFVMGAVPGDVVDVLVLRKKKSYGYGVVKVMKELSPHRVKPFCQHFEDCGGCKWQNLSYQEQLVHKWQTVHNAFTRIAKLDGGIIEPIVASKEIMYYRNKLEYTFSYKRYIPQAEVDSSGEIEPRPAVGFHIGGAWDKILDIETCYLQNDLSDDIRNFLRKFAIEKSYSFYDVKTHKGFFRNVVIRNTLQGDWLVIVVFGKEDPKKIMNTMEAMKEQFPFITSLNYIINTKLNDSIFDQEVHTYHGLPYMVEKLGHVKYKVGPKSFFQTNSHQAKALFDIVKEYAGFKPTDNVYDLYTGLGSIALYIANEVKHVTGIEEIPEAIMDANENAIFNGMENTTFYAGDVKDLLTTDFAQKHGKPDVIITDPPRAGMHQDVCEVLLVLEAPKIVYVSCNAATQARDLAILGQKYKVERARPVDMFPHTHHVENVALLTLIHQ